MFSLKSNRIGILLVFSTSVLLLMAYQSADKIRFFRSATISLQPDTVRAYWVNFQDHVSKDSLYQIKSEEGYPIAYFRKIKTGVCSDNECRLLDIELYWNITGRYLGFELPEGEFLSKFDHDPFITSEYERLNELLADSLSPLGTFTYHELAPKSDAVGDPTDAVSSATSKNVLAYVVEGAAFTTYTLWQIVYGPTQHEVMHLTKRELSSGLILKMLESPDVSDKVWAINHIRGYVALTPELRDTLLQLIDDDNYNLAERAIHAIDPLDLASDSLQLLLLEKIYETNYSLKKLIIDKMKEAPHLNTQVKLSLAHHLSSLHSGLLSNVLELYQEHQVSDVETCLMIATLLQDENNFIAQKAFKFLENADIQDEIIHSQLSEYKSRQDSSQMKE